MSVRCHLQGNKRNDIIKMQQLDDNPSPKKYVVYSKSRLQM
nr:MAG TPA: hypothetical protein [Caudoviricetes sp.]